MELGFCYYVFKFPIISQYWQEFYRLAFEKPADNVKCICHLDCSCVLSAYIPDFIRKQMTGEQGTADITVRENACNMLFIIGDDEETLLVTVYLEQSL